MIDSVCDWCGNYKKDCSQYKSCFVCKDCQTEHKHARDILRKAELATMVKRMEARTC